MRTITLTQDQVNHLKSILEDYSAIVDESLKDFEEGSEEEANAQEELSKVEDLYNLLG